MTAAAPSRFNALPTAAKLLIFISLALLPLGLGLVGSRRRIRAANNSNLQRSRPRESRRFARLKA